MAQFVLHVRTQSLTCDEFAAYQTLITELSRERVDRLEHINALIASPHDHVVFVYTRCGALIGMARLHVRVNGWGIEGLIDDVIVLEQHRGRGIGTTLMRTLHGEAKRRGVTRCTLTSKPERTDAHRRYLELGYRQKNTVVLVKTPI